LNLPIFLGELSLSISLKFEFWDILKFSFLFFLCGT